MGGALGTEHGKCRNPSACPRTRGVLEPGIIAFAGFHGRQRGIGVARIHIIENIGNQLGILFVFGIGAGAAIGIPFLLRNGFTLSTVDRQSRNHNKYAMFERFDHLRPPFGRRLSKLWAVADSWIFLGFRSVF
jgi:hypothetical protein